MPKHSSISRRKFIHRVGQAGGSSAAYLAMAGLGFVGSSNAFAQSNLWEKRLPRGDGKSVIILGAGVAGMSAAFELSNLGYHCTVLEARNRAGGRNETLRHGDVTREIDSVQVCDFDREEHLYANMGPARIPHHHRTLLRYCRQFGVELEVIVNENRAAFFHDSRAFGGDRLHGREVNAGARGLISEMLAKALNKGSLDNELSPEDRERFFSFLKEYGDLDEHDKYAGSGRAGYGENVNEGLDPSGFKEPFSLSELLSSDFWQYKMHFGEGINQQATMLQPKGGMDQIAHAFEKRTRSMISYEVEVNSIHNTQDGVSVSYIDGKSGAESQIQGDFCICTIPCPVLKDIPSNFPQDVKSAIESAKYTPAGKIAFQSERFWEDQAIYGGISWTTEDITQIWYPSNNFHSLGGVLIGGYIWDDEPALRFAAQNPEERVRFGVAQGSLIHPEYSDYVRRGISRSWLNMKYQKGAWPESYDGPPKAMAKACEQVYFAGDHMSYLPGWQEGSLLAAHHVVEQIALRSNVS